MGALSGTGNFTGLPYTAALEICTTRGVRPEHRKSSYNEKVRAGPEAKSTAGSRTERSTEADPAQWITTCGLKSAYRLRNATLPIAACLYG